MSALVAPILNGEAECSTAQIIDQDRAHIHFDGGGMNFQGIAYQHNEGKAYTEDQRGNESCLFPCGAAMAITRVVFLDAGGFDDGFFAYFEDIDLDWRLWLLGYRVSYVPNAITVHKQSQTSRFIDLCKLRVLHIRNPLIMIYKIYNDSSLGAIWPVAWMLTNSRTLHLNELDRRPFRIGGEPQRADIAHTLPKAYSEQNATVELDRLAVSDFVALNDWLDHLPSLIKKRSDIQSKRVIPDTQLTPLFREPFRYCENQPSYQQLQDSLCEQFGINYLFKAVDQ